MLRFICIFIFQCLNEVVPEILKVIKDDPDPATVCADIKLCDGMFVILKPKNLSNNTGTTHSNALANATRRLIG